MDIGENTQQIGTQEIPYYEQEHTRKKRLSKGTLQLFQKLYAEVEILRKLETKYPLLQDTLYWDSTCYHLIRVGEILKNLAPEKRELLVIDDRRIMNCRDMLAHTYQNVDEYEVRLVMCMCTKDMYDKLKEIVC